MKDPISERVIKAIDAAREAKKIDKSDLEISKMLTEGKNMHLINKVRTNKQKFPNRYIDKISLFLSISSDHFYTGKPISEGKIASEPPTILEVESVIPVLQKKKDLSYIFELETELHETNKKYIELLETKEQGIDKVAELQKKIEELTEAVSKLTGTDKK